MISVVVSYSMFIFLCPQAFGEINMAFRFQQSENGRRQLELLQSDAEMPKYGTCFTQAVRDLKSGCKRLTEDEQSRLALAFTNCFLDKSGLPIYPCSRDSNIATCLSTISTKAFTAYSNFFTHTQNMCYFLQAQVWQESTDWTIERLRDSSQMIIKSVEETLSAQQILAENQRLSLKYHKQVITNTSLLQKALETSKNNVKEILEDFKTSTDEQKVLIYHVFERLSKFQSQFISEISWFQSVVFNLCVIGVIYLVTSTKRTSESRLGLYCLLALNFLAERYLSEYCFPFSECEDSEKSPEIIYRKMWLIRKTFFVLSVLILAFYIYTHVDYIIVNNRLLETIRRQNHELKEAMVELRQHNKQSNDSHYRLNETGPVTRDYHDGKLNPYTGEATDYDSGHQADESSDDGTKSFLSKTARSHRKEAIYKGKTFVSTPDLPQKVYNLRSSAKKIFINEEVVEDFQEDIARAAKVTRKNARKINLALKSTKKKFPI